MDITRDEGMQVSDDDWASPGGGDAHPGTPSRSPEAAPAPVISADDGARAVPQQPVPPQYAAPPRYGRPAASVGYAPPPRPGLIPLSPLSFGTILGAPYRLFRRNPRPTFGMSLAIQGGVMFLTLVVLGLVSWATLSRVGFASTTAERDDILSGSFVLIGLSAIVPTVLSSLATGIMQGAIVLEVARQTVGEKSSFRDLWRRGRSRLWAVGGYSVAVLFAVGVVLAVLVVIAIVPVALGGQGSLGATIGAVVLLSLGLAVLYAWLATKLAFVPSAIVIERLGILPAIGRSWSLSRGAFWKILGTTLLVAAILGFAAQVVQFPLSFVGGIVIGLLSPTGDDPEAVIPVVIGLYLVIIVITLVIAAISLVVQSATTALLYLDRRVRTEGLDLDLMRYVEARQLGDVTVPDPFPAPNPSWTR